MSEIEARVIRAIQPLVPVDVTTETCIDDLDLDSLGFMNIMFAVATEFDRDIRTEDFPKIRTVGDVAVAIESALIC